MNEPTYLIMKTSYEIHAETEKLKALHSSLKKSTNRGGINRRDGILSPICAFEAGETQFDAHDFKRVMRAMLTDEETIEGQYQLTMAAIDWRDGDGRAPSEIWQEVAEGKRHSFLIESV